jgi:hypothetical protein
MVATASLRPFRRTSDGILIHLRLEEWPADVPLPKGAKVVETGGGPFMPYWLLVFKAEQTIEVIVGWYRFPCSLDEAVAWYPPEMEKLGWTQDTAKGHNLEESAALNFQHSQTGARVEISIVQPKGLDDSRVMIRRVLEHPYTPSADESAATQAAPLPAEAEANP